MKRKLTAVFAAAVMLLQAVPAFAAENRQIQQINITVAAPADGQKADEKPKVNTDCGGITVTNAYWADAEDITKPFEGTFDGGSEYPVVINLSVEQDYEISESDFTVKVNGTSASGTIEAGSITVYSSVKAAPENNGGSTKDSPSTADSATADSGRSYDSSNNANGSIPTNEDNKTFIIFGVVIGIVAAAGIAYFIYTKKNGKK